MSTARAQLARFLARLRQWQNRALDRLASRGDRRGATPSPTAAHAAGRVISFGLWLMLGVFGIGGVWAAVAPLDSAAVAPGTVALDSNHRVIQHLEGGIVEEIMVHEGDRVKAGQPLMRLRQTASKAKLQSLKSQRFTARASEARLIAERDLKEQVAFSHPVFADAAQNTDEGEVLSNQEKLFASHRSAFDTQVRIVGQKIKESEQEIVGYSVEIKSETSEIAMLEEEAGGVKRLLEHGNSTKTRLLELERQIEELRGARGKNIAAIASAEQAINESKLQIINVQQQHITETVKELKDTQLQVADLEEQIRTSTDILDRIMIYAPLEGFVTSLNVHTVGGVVTPGEKLMEIVPAGDKLIIEAQVSPQDIHVVHPGLVAHVRLSAYRTRYIPLIDGKVLTVSADRISDPKSNNNYYLARIEADASQLKALKEVELYPGMPADVLIVTGSRSLLAYLFNPLSQTVQKSFREE